MRPLQFAQQYVPLCLHLLRSGWSCCGAARCRNRRIRRVSIDAHRRCRLARLSRAARAARVRRQGLDHVSYALDIEAVARASATVAVILAVHNSLVCDVDRHGSARRDQQAAVAAAPRDRRGPRRVCPLGGRCGHRRGQPADDRDAHRRRLPLTGRKVWVANGEVAGARARVRRDRSRVPAVAASRPSSCRSIAAGIRRDPGVDSLGVRGLGCVDLVLDDVEVSDGERLGDENAGFADRAARAGSGPHRDCRAGAGGRPGRARRGARLTRGRARPSAARSRNTRRFSGSSPIWPPSSRPRAC